MRNPARALAKQFLDRNPVTLLLAGLIVSLLDFALLCAAAVRESVLRIDQGVGLLDNHGLLSTLIGNAFSLFIVKKYYECVRSMKKSEAVVNPKVIIDPSLSTLSSMIEMRDGRARFLIRGLIITGAIVWLANVAFHVFGNPEIKWGYKVFDSIDHPLSFVASRLHNLYTWLLIMPFVGHVMVVTTFQLRQVIKAASDKNALKYDLLNPDQRGGFGFIDNAHIAFNLVVALIYVQITLHFLTFRMNPEHIIGYIILTLALIGINWVFLGDIYAKIKALKFASLNELKHRVFDDKLNFDVLKYCLEQKTSIFSTATVAIKTAGFIIPLIVKAWPYTQRIYQSLR
jgi:hypothetical protein